MPGGLDYKATGTAVRWFELNLAHDTARRRISADEGNGLFLQLQRLAEIFLLPGCPGTSAADVFGVGNYLCDILNPVFYIILIQSAQSRMYFH